jgi:hypothetical protein
VTETVPRATSELPPVVVTALSVLGVRPARVAALTSDLPWAPSARTFLIVTADGTRLKARVRLRADWAARTVLLAERLADPGVPVPLARVGRVTFDQWVDGASLSTTRLTGEHIRAAADLLRRIHRFAGLERERLPHLRRTGPIRARAWRQLEELTAAGVIGKSDSAQLSRVIEQALPAAAPWGLIHGDLCWGKPRPAAGRGAGERRQRAPQARLPRL